MVVKPFKRAVADFNRAKKRLDKMESDLGKSVGKELEKIGIDFDNLNTNHVNDIQGIIEQLPKSCEASRRLYELIHHICRNDKT